MNKVLMVAAIAEGLTGLALLIAPSLVAQLLLGHILSGPAIAVARVTAIALIALSVACWPGPAPLGMTVYSVLVTLYLGHLGLSGYAVGALLWPAVLLHLIMSALLIAALVQEDLLPWTWSDE